MAESSVTIGAGRRTSVMAYIVHARLVPCRVCSTGSTSSTCPTGIAGPMTAMMLVDNGARVTRIDAPTRRQPSLGHRDGACGHAGCAAPRSTWTTLHDLEVLRTLAQRADIVIDSFAPGAAARYGLDHATLAATNPRLITCSISGYGTLTAHRDRPADDALVAAADRPAVRPEGSARHRRWSSSTSGPGPHPEFDVPDDLVRGADRDGPDLSGHAVAEHRRHVPSRARYRGGAARARDHRRRPARHDIGAPRRAGRSCAELAARRTPGRAALLDVARRRPLDRRAVPVRRRSLGASLDGASGMGVRLGRGRRARARWTSARNTATTPTGSAWRPTTCSPASSCTRCLAEAFAKFPSDDWVRVGERGRCRRRARPLPHRGARRRVVPRRRLRRRGRRSRDRAHPARRSRARAVGNARRRAGRRASAGRTHRRGTRRGGARIHIESHTGRARRHDATSARRNSSDRPWARCGGTVHRTRACRSRCRRHQDPRAP